MPRWRAPRWAQWRPICGSTRLRHGANGAGKAALVKGSVGMVKPLAGGIDLCGLRARDIAYLPQAAEIDRTFPISVYDLVAMGLWREAGLFGGIGKRERDKMRTAIMAAD